MATQGIAGRRGLLSLAPTSSSTATEVLEMTEYELEVSQDGADASSNDSSGWNEHVQTNRQWTLRYSIIATSQNYAGIGWSNFFRTYQKRWMTLYPSTSSTGNRYQGYILAQSGEVSGDLNDVIRADFVWEGHRALLYTS